MNAIFCLLSHTLRTIYLFSVHLASRSQPASSFMHSFTSFSFELEKHTHKLCVFCFCFCLHGSFRSHRMAEFACNARHIALQRIGRWFICYGKVNCCFVFSSTLFLSLSAVFITVKNYAKASVKLIRARVREWQMSSTHTKRAQTNTRVEERERVREKLKI